ncbi:hypothetical protein HUF15_45235 [Streptomyces samsunensis]|uniref:hypothetical protein n=1 Tax=Streptomyces malaysiensis TaxID=92644 RepID=UPI00158397D7|nr:hypothetical protein [Streptomyces samsunensis]NUH43808.1 hypothetical protein [Streptomyces samsunensis]
MTTLEASVRHLASRGYRKDRSELSRYMNGRRLPPRSFVELLYEAAAEQAGGEDALSITQHAVLSAHASAEPTLCKHCNRFKRSNNKLRRELRRLHRIRAGLEARLIAARKQPAPLPVPSPQGDRQQRAYDVVAANQIVGMAARIDAQQDHEAAVAMLRVSAEALTPFESAASLAILRHQQHDQLADELIQMYGRDQPEGQVIRAALELHAYGLPEDAGAMLRAAAR